MPFGGRIGLLLMSLTLTFVSGPGCATMRRATLNRDLRPCTEGYAETADGWRIGIRHYRSDRPDPTKDPVVLCHGMGLNGTFWTLTDDHLPRQLNARGYDVFVPDMRGSGASHRDGTVGWVNALMRETFIREVVKGDLSMDAQALHDVPAILDFVQAETGKARVNWIGHSLGGMLMFAFFERSPHAHRVSNFVAMGAPACLAVSPNTSMLKANRNLRLLLYAFSTGRIARPLSLARPPGLDKIDRMYYTADNVDRRTVNRFYAFTLEDPGSGTLEQLDTYLEFGHLVSVNRQIDYFEGLGSITVPSLFVAGDGDIMADLPSKQRTFDALGSPDKTLLRFGRQQGHYADDCHCDLVWSRYAPDEIFPEIIDWLDDRQPGRRPSPQGPRPATVPSPSPSPIAIPVKAPFLAP
ncbi:alpha/beta fold hydrolase [soil metagenome]